MSDIIFKIRVLWWQLRSTYEEWKNSVWHGDMDALACCDGRECCCGGETNRTFWGWFLAKEKP